MIKIKTASREFEVDRTVLENFSGYFKAMFYHKTLKENLVNTVDLSESVVSGEALECLLHYMMTGSLSFTVDRLDDTLSAIDYLHLETLQDLLYLQVWQNIDATNFVSIWKIAKKYELKEYEHLVEQYIIKEFCLDCVRQNLSEIQKLDLEEMLQILHVVDGVPLRKVSSELEVFRIAVLWLDRRDREIRQHCAYEVNRIIMNQKLFNFFSETKRCKNKTIYI